jgi:ribosomal-protein-alanine N-acetyltransferase
VEFPLLSERLLLRPFERSDAPAAHDVYRDEVVMRWVGTGPVSRLEQTEAMLSGYMEHQRKYGFSFWAVVKRDSGQLVGDAGLYSRGDRIELGYTLGREHWGIGYGTEAARSCVQAAFGPLGLDELEALVRRENHASASVLRKLGFESRDRVFVHGSPHVRFVLQRQPAGRAR